MKIFNNLRLKIEDQLLIQDGGQLMYIKRSILMIFFYCLRQNILNKVTVNGMSGSLWRFRRFIMLNVKTLNLETKRDRKIKCQTLLTLS